MTSELGVYARSPLKRRMTETDRRIVEIVRAHPEGIKASAIAEELGEQIARGQMRRCNDNGWLRRKCIDHGVAVWVVR